MCPTVAQPHKIRRWAGIALFASLLNHSRLRKWIVSLEEPAAQVRRAVGRLPKVSAKLEKIYLSIQDEVERLASLAGRLVQEAHDLVRMASGRETGTVDFDRVLFLLERPLAFLNAAVIEMPVLAADLAAASATVVETMKLETALDRTLGPLKCIQTLFRVESVALPAESREIFLGLAAEITALVERVQESSGRQFQMLKEVGATLRDAVARMETHHRQQVHLLTARRTEIEATIQRMAEEAKANAQRKVQLTEVSTAFSTSVSGAITALQTQDIVAQRLQHAAAALNDALAAIDSARANPDEDAAGRIVSLARIEVAQIDEVIGELHKSESALRASTSNVVERVGRIDDECVLLGEFQHITVSVDGIVQVLIDSLATLRAMTAETLDIARRFDQLLEPAESALGRFTTSVDEVAASMRRIALNAQIRAVQIGGRSGLEVLASRTDDIARDALRISDAVSEGLSRCSAKVAAGIERLHRLRDSGPTLDGKRSFAGIQ